MTTSDAKRITYDRASKDYLATFDGQPIGYFPNYHAAEVALDDYALDLIEQGLVDDMQILARPAEVVELVYRADPGDDGPELAINDHVRIIDVTRTPDRDSEMLNGTTGVIIAVHHKQYEVMFDGNAFGPYYDRDWFFESELELIQALPAAPPAVENTVHTSDSFSDLEVSTAAGREDAAPDFKEYNTDVVVLLRASPYRMYAAKSIVRQTGRSFSTVRDTLNRLRDAGFVERDLDIGLNGHTLYKWYWCGPGSDAVEHHPALASTASPDPATPTVAPAYCLHLDTCAASSCPACVDPAGPYRCPLCQTNAHYATQCPDVALTKYGMGVWGAYMEDRAAFLRLIQWAAAARLLLMGNAVAHYLSARWGHPITGHQVLVAWMQNAAPAS